MVGDGGRQAGRRSDDPFLCTTDRLPDKSKIAVHRVSFLQTSLVLESTESLFLNKDVKSPCY